MDASNNINSQARLELSSWSRGVISDTKAKSSSIGIGSRVKLASAEPSVSKCREEALSIKEKIATGKKATNWSVTTPSEGVTVRMNAAGRTVLQAQSHVRNIFQAGEAFPEKGDSPKEISQKIIGLMKKFPQDACDALYKLDSANVDSVIKELFNNKEASAQVFALTLASISREVKESPYEANLLRGNTVASKMMADTMKNEMRSKMQKAFAGDCLGKEPLMTDKKVNVSKTTAVLGNILGRTRQMLAEGGSPKVKTMLTHLSREVEAKFPGNGDKHVTTTFFLRYLNPSIVAPNGFFGGPNHAGEQMRNAILATKLLQSMANGTPCGFKETHLSVMDPTANNFKPLFQEITALLKNR